MNHEVKITRTTKYILFPFVDARWVWSRGYYFVHPDSEDDFVKYIETLDSIKPVKDS